MANPISLLKILFKIIKHLFLFIIFVHASWHVGSDSLTRDQTGALCFGSTGAQTTESPGKSLLWETFDALQQVYGSGIPVPGNTATESASVPDLG